MINPSLIKWVRKGVVSVIKFFKMIRKPLYPNHHLFHEFTMKTYLQKGNKALLTLNQKTSKKVLVNAVVLLEGNINYTIFHLENGKQNVVAHSIKFFEPFLKTHGFLRVHRSYMINPNHIKNLDEQLQKITMNNGKEAMISRRNKSISQCLL